MPNDEIAFLLNDRDVQTSVPPGMLVLDFLRLDRRLTGTKEGCREGDCGACAVLVGELDGDAVRYKPVTSCLMPVGELHGKHLVSIEGLNTAALSPVQEAIVEEGATQCGFCTPGIVVSLTGFLIGEGEIDLEGVKYALGGHLCRCTGYRSLKNGRGHLERALGRRAAVDALVDRGGLPDYFREVPGRLRRIPSNTPRALNGGWTAAVAGGTDLYVQQGDAVERQSGLAVLNRHASLQGIDRDGDELRIGALTTFEDFADHVEVRGLIPQIRDYMHLIASWQIRNRATLGGNIINASPIGDLTVLLLALRAKLVLHGGDRPRQLPIEEFYQGYKKTDLGTGEVLTRIHLDSRPGRLVHFEKVSKRKCLDIATVNSAIGIRVAEGVIEEVGLALGGVAPIPLFLSQTCRFLFGKPVTAEVVEEACAQAQREISPISDVRGSADYRRLLARQLLIAHFVRLFPDRVRVEEFY